MPVPLLCDCGRRFEPPAPVGAFATCPDCGRDVAVPKPGPPEDILFVGDPRPPAARWRRVATIGVASVGLLWLAANLPAMLEPRESTRRALCVNNLKMIGLALHNYHEAHGSLPPAAVVGQDGRPLLSWRVLILPYLEAGDLYAKFRLDEPWDSPHNRPLAAMMPRDYACPSDPALAPGPKSGLTGYQVVVGPETAFAPDFRPVRLDQITDGAANTILVGESPHLVPWTKPDDLRVGSLAPLVGLGSHHRLPHDGFHVLFADTRVRALKGTTPPATLRCYLTRAGGDCCFAEAY